MSVPFFAYLNNFWEKTYPFNSYETNAYHYSPIRIASFHMDSFVVAKSINELPHLPEWGKAAVLYYGLPKRKAVPKKLPKKPKKPTTKKYQKESHIIDVLSKKYGCSLYHGGQIWRILKSEGISIGEL